MPNLSSTLSAISPEKQVSYWRAQCADRNAEGWDLPRELKDSLQSGVTKNEALNRHTQALEASAPTIYLASARNVEKALQTAFPRGHGYQAIRRFMLHGDLGDALSGMHNIILAASGLTFYEAEEKVMRLIKPLEMR